jgi:hypothetical protein
LNLPHLPASSTAPVIHVSFGLRCAQRGRVVGLVVAIAALMVVPFPRSLSAHAATARFVDPPIRHIWVIVLENKSYNATFGDPTADPYLASTLREKGAFLENYYAIGHDSAPNYLALVSGQPPNSTTQADCQVFAPFSASKSLDGIESGDGCVYPAGIPTIGTELSAKGSTWKAYEQDMGNDPSREASACGHPTVGSVDRTQDAAAGDGYATRHDPFVYFESVIGDPSYCDAHVVALGSPTGALPTTAIKGETGLAIDLKRAKTTPAYSFITPNLCADGHDYPCVNSPNGTSTLADVDSFLSVWVPKIMASSAYRQGGLIEVTFDESDGPAADSSACCGETPGPGTQLPGITGPGGGRVGAVLLSPDIRPGTVSLTPYNHYSLLATDEKLLGVPLLGEARTVTSMFGADVFTPRRGG